MVVKLVVGPSDQTTPCTLHTAPLLFIEQLATCSATPSRLVEGVANADRPTTDAAEEGVDARLDTNADAKATFPGSSHVTSIASIVTKFVVNDELIPIKIENIPGDYRLFNLVFIICF